LVKVTARISKAVPFGAQDVANAGRKHARLAGPCASQHQQRPVERLDRLTLLGIERIEIMAGTTPLARSRW
jgi:hypothetical protein